jgi:cephalosporin-C deacetylase-like acetyl esterase
MAEEMPLFGKYLDGWCDADDQVIHDLRARAEQGFRAQETAKAGLNTIEAFEAHRASVREHFLNAIGGLPGDTSAKGESARSALNVRITGTFEAAGFTIEKLIYESLPSFPVSAACYVPHNLSGTAPTVVFVHGHSDEGKSYLNYQAVCADLADNGFIVLAIDPVGQGERFQFLEKEQRLFGPCTVEHTHAAIPFWLQGASVARQFIWDIMRGIDYLETRPDVDKTRIGMTGNSGGGTQTSYLMMTEPRIAAAMPCTFIMTLESMMKTGMPQDGEQIIQGCFVNGPDHDDFLTSMAPRPVRVGAVAWDLFPIEGSYEAVERAKKIYGLYGKEENVELFVDTAYHSYSQGLRQACVQFFQKHLQHIEPNFIASEAIALPPDALQVTSTGQVLSEDTAAISVLELGCPTQPSVADSTRDAATLRYDLDAILGVSKVGDRFAPLYPRKANTGEGEAYRWEKVWFFSAPDIATCGVIYHPLQGAPTDKLPTTLLLLRHGTDDAASQAEGIERLAREGQRVFVFDVRGVGGVKARSVTSYDRPDFLSGIFNGDYKFACDTMMLGLSMLGMRVFDVLRACDYLRMREDVAEVRLHGIGSGAVWAFFAAALDENVASLTCEEMLISYRLACETKMYSHEVLDSSIIAWGILKAGDFVDLLPVLGERPVRLLKPVDAQGQPLTEALVQQYFWQPAEEIGAGVYPNVSIK